MATTLEEGGGGKALVAGPQKITFFAASLTHPDFGTLWDKVFDEVEDESFTTRFLRLALVEKFRSFIDIACNMVHPVPVPVPVTVTTPVTVI